MILILSELYNVPLCNIKAKPVRTRSLASAAQLLRSTRNLIAHLARNHIPRDQQLPVAAQHRLRDTKVFAHSEVRCSSLAAPLEAAERSIRAAPPSISGAEIRERFLKFYEIKGHKRLSSSSLVPQDPTVLLTIAGMLQFKPVFLGQEARKFPSATTTQKCIRTNDIENVGVTKRHHTFFEMLGNFSFGDYFKEEAVHLAWELSTRVLNIPAERIWVSVFEDDDEAYQIWSQKVGVPKERIQRLGPEDNFWASGATGPCGPCSELYYDFKPELGTSGASLEDDSRFVEFYNLVFMESNRLPDNSLEPLQQRNIDTGMGLERVAQILQGAANNYETDLILPLVLRAAEISGLQYQEASTRQQAALKVIADHARAVTYLISDGVRPSNVGRGYVLRRLLRRAVMKGRVMGVDRVFLPEVVQVAIDLSHGCDADVQKNARLILEEVAREEERFNAALEAGRKPLAEILERAAAGGQISGPDAFLLYDTYGFPLEITLDSAADSNLKVDVEGFEAELEEQRRRSKAAVATVDMEVGGVLAGLSRSLSPTAFSGHHGLQTEGTVLAILTGGRSVPQAFPGEEIQLILDSTPFYAEGGGQIGDRGQLTAVTENPTGPGGAAPACLSVHNVQKAAGGALYVHSAKMESGCLSTGDKVAAAVDEGSRRRARCNHTATHLLHAALRLVLPGQVSQQGSAVTFDSLRFDFNLDRPTKAEELQQIEALVNQWIQESHQLVTTEMPIDEAKAAGAVAMFGEKYGDVVRVVDVPGVSMELCGGTHAANTADLAAFKIKGEQGIASGIRRIEAVAGPAALEYLNQRDSIVHQLGSLLKAAPSELTSRVSGLQEEVASLKKQLAEAKSSAALAQAEGLVSRAQTLGNGVKSLIARLDDLDAKNMQDVAEFLLQQLGDPAAVVLLGSPEASKVSMLAAFSPKVVAGGLQAGKFIGGIAKICGGGGGGRPNLAQAGGKDASKLPEALEAAQNQLLDSLGTLKA